MELNGVLEQVLKEMFTGALVARLVNFAWPNFAPEIFARPEYLPQGSQW